jgi:hypothetical protein
MTKKRLSASRNPRSTKDKDITYVCQEHISKLAKEKSAFARWCEMEELRLGARPEGRDFEKAYKESQEEKQQRPIPPSMRPVLPMPFPRTEGEEIVALEKPLYFSRPTCFSDGEVVDPTKTFIYSGSPAFPSDLIYPCPDLQHWGALFEDDEVTLNQGYRYWFPSNNEHPALPNFSFSGRFIVYTHFVMEGIVDIGRYGYVTVDVATYITVIQCDADDKNHDSGWHNDPNYDSVIGCQWVSYCQGNQPRFFSDNQQGLHTFRHYIDLPVRVMCTTGAPNRFVEPTHILTITAVNAHCCFGPSSQECAPGERGFIETYFPTVYLEYVPHLIPIISHPR